jgi:hypothetical protein
MVGRSPYLWTSVLALRGRAIIGGLGHGRGNEDDVVSRIISLLFRLSLCRASFP